MRLKDLESRITLTGRYEPLQENSIIEQSDQHLRPVSLKKTVGKFALKKKQLENRGNVLLQQTKCFTLFGEIASGEVAFQKDYLFGGIKVKQLLQGENY